nr:unnamed protein product [Digitaria exilis]
MGCVCSRRFHQEPAPRALTDAYTARRGRYGPGDYDSGELAIPPPKPPPSHKVSDMDLKNECNREELTVFSKEVIRFGDLCKDPIWHNLGRYFDKYSPEKYALLATDNTPQDHSKESMEATVQYLVNLAQNTSIVEKLVDIVIFLHKQIRDSFKEAETGFFNSEHTQNQKLGSCGLALHYANIINQIENIVSRPLSLPPSSRDNLYHGLPIAVKSALRSRLQSSDTEEERTVAQIKAEMQKTLRWLLPIAENTLRAHQGFGWVGEWANLGSDMGKKSGSQYGITRIQTLHHADKDTTEQFILELVVLLHHLVLQVKNRGYGNKSTKHERSKSKVAIDLHAPETRHNTSPVNASVVASSPLSECERAALDHVSFRRASYGRSQSCEPPPGRGRNKTHRSWDACRSQGSSPARERGRSPAGAAMDRDTARDLDVIDGLDRLTSYSHPSSPTFC